MQKKLIRRLLIGLLMINLSACASHPWHSTTKNQAAALDKPNDIFLDTSIAHFMGDADHNKLHDLIATAQAEQLTSWYSATSGARFEFISQKIFVNQIKVMRGFVTYPSFNYTACRDSEGVWQVVSH